MNQSTSILGYANAMLRQITMKSNTTCKQMNNLGQAGNKS